MQGDDNARSADPGSTRARLFDTAVSRAGAVLAVVLGLFALVAAVRSCAGSSSGTPRLTLSYVAIEPGVLDDSSKFPKGAVVPVDTNVPSRTSAVLDARQCVSPKCQQRALGKVSVDHQTLFLRFNVGDAGGVIRLSRVLYRFPARRETSTFEFADPLRIDRKAVLKRYEIVVPADREIWAAVVSVAISRDHKATPDGRRTADAWIPETDGSLIASLKWCPTARSSNGCKSLAVRPPLKSLVVNTLLSSHEGG